jgi:hypothetical protein
MADPELVQVMDYILNRCDEKNIEAVAAAVVRRRRDLALFGGMNHLPDPHKMAQEISGQFSIGAGIDGLKETIRDMAVRIIKQEAPELTEKQAAELIRAWVPESKAPGSSASWDKNSGEKQLPPDLLESMIEQFIAFSTGDMSPGEDKTLRAEMGSWPDRYWKAFPQVVQLIIRDFLKGEINEKEFRSKIAIALQLG